MAENNNTMFIGVAQIQRDWGISRSKAYQIIKELNAELKKKNPGELIASGMKRLAFREVVRTMAAYEKNTGKIKASQKRGKYARKCTYVNLSNLIVLLFCVLINQKHRRHYGK